MKHNRNALLLGAFGFCTAFAHAGGEFAVKIQIHMLAEIPVVGDLVQFGEHRMEHGTGILHQHDLLFIPADGFSQ